ncbi:LOW QUALITY PROTEIN: bestrophin-4 [Glossophaga mutica]
MMVSYTLKAAEARFGGFSWLLLHWRVITYKLLCKELLLLVVLSALLSVAYRLLLTQEQGSYVTLVANCWWAQYTNIPLPDQLMGIISATVHSLDQRGCQPRHTLVCCAALASVLPLCSVSTQVLKRIPVMERMVRADCLSQEMRKKFESLKFDFKYWVPHAWLTNLAAQAQRDGISDGAALCLLLGEPSKYGAERSSISLWLDQHPSVCPQVTASHLPVPVVTTAVHSFFALSLVGRQFVEPEAGAAKPWKPLEPGQEPGPELRDLDVYVPLITLLQLLLYGWLKVAERIINLFDEDDDEFETDQLIDHNLVSLLSLVNMQKLPPAKKDPYREGGSAQPPNTAATVAQSVRPFFLGSTFNLR